MLVFPGFEPLDFFGPAEAFLMLARFHHLEVYTITNQVDLTPVSTEFPAEFPQDIVNPHRSRAFQSIVPTHTLETAPADLDVLLVPGGWGAHATDKRMAALVTYVRTAYPRLTALMSVCTGSRLLALTGLLDGRRATTAKDEFDKISAGAPAVEWVRNARWVQEGNIWTSSGVSAGTDAVLALVAERFGLEIAQRAANEMEYEWRNDPNHDPFVAVFPPKNLKEDK